jgi:hypothetical protein
MRPSSLQSAVASTVIKTGKGHFESTFAAGLDLSEFQQKEPRNRGSNTSQSRALLDIKCKEKRFKEDQLAEDERISSLVHDKIVKLRNEAVVVVGSKKTCNDATASLSDYALRLAPPQALGNAFLQLRGGGIVDTLVGMHSLDKKDERVQHINRKNQRVSKKSNRHKHSKRK